MGDVAESSVVEFPAEQVVRVVALPEPDFGTPLGTLAAATTYARENEIEACVVIVVNADGSMDSFRTPNWIAADMYLELGLLQKEILENVSNQVT